MTASGKANDLEQRMVLFATNIIKLCGQLRDSPEARHITSQILRSGTAAAPNYAEARAAESRADFIHKLRIALKELNETSVWLRMLEGNVAENPDFLTALVAENRELCRILVASIQTARRNSESE
jgi:four helix bundle protein